MSDDAANHGPISAERPAVPDGYGLPSSTDGLLAWPAVEAELVAALTYWLTSVRPDGRPHVVPRWGVWLDGCFYYDGSPQTRHTRNVEQNPYVTLNLESGTRTVIVEGTSVASRAEPDDLGARLADAFGKYRDAGYSPGADSWSGPDGGGLRIIRPSRALAWFAFPTDCTRFRFG